MILWTIQNEQILDDLIRNKVHRLYDFKKAGWGEESTDIRNAYEWLGNVMCNTIGSPTHNNQYPIWAWYIYEGKRKKPDMRHTGFAPTGTGILRITLDIPDDKVLLSDYDLWHHPLNNWHLPLCENDELKFEDLDITLKQEAKIESWKHIFDIDTVDDGYIFGSSEDKMIQATFWDLKEEYIVSIEKFTAR